MAEEQARILSELIDRKIDARVNHIETMMEKMVRLIKRMRETSSSERIDKMEKDIASMKETLESFNFKSLEEDMVKQLADLRKKVAPDEKNLHRDIEQLKTKTQWMELEVEKLDITPLLERLNEIEARIDTFRLTQPTVIE